MLSLVISNSNTSIFHSSVHCLLHAPYSILPTDYSHLGIPSGQSAINLRNLHNQ
jgi:hypothetical protein